MKAYQGELWVGIGLFVLLFVLFNPFNVFMPGYLVMGMLIGLLLLFIAFAIFLWREGRGDERERYHLLLADRVAYLAGSAILITGIVIGELQHALSGWLIAALAVMVAAKIVGLVYGKNKL